MKCSHCGSADNKVLETRYVLDEFAVRRRRGCNECGRSFTTYEVQGGVWATISGIMRQHVRSLKKKHQLLERDKQIAKLIEAGVTHKVIGGQFGLAERSVRNVAKRMGLQRRRKLRLKAPSPWDVLTKGLKP